MIKMIFSLPTSRVLDGVLLILRVSIAVLMLVHGLPKFQLLLSGAEIQFANVMGMGAEVSLALTVFAEVWCSVLIMVGLGTRVAVIPLIITMLVAVFYIHGQDPFIKQEMGLHYLLVYSVLLIAGSGRHSADFFIGKRFVGVQPENQFG